MPDLTPEDRDRLRELAENATPGPWLPHARYVWTEDLGGIIQNWSEDANAAADMEFIAASRQAVPALLDMLDQAETTLAAIKARDEEVSTDEGWWIGGAWGDYGEVVVPLRILSYVIDGNLDQKVTETSPDYALTYAEQVARADQAEARIQAVRDVLAHHPYGGPDQEADIRRALEG